ncbi:uncharacterized protein LOC134770245 [Penaeus indicus]|uniref:uncharacterized protein LOC134770245 n=1 Tax=Penaeus indicus TaxID=29960 RepID=UPI00300C0968
MMKQPNEYEMVAFVWGRFSTYLGLGIPTQVSPGLETTTSSSGNSPNNPLGGEEGADDGAGNDKVKELPNKVDKFLDYLNDVYFAGSLDVTNKDALKSSFYRGNGRGNSATPNNAKPRSAVRFGSGVGERTGGGGKGGGGGDGDLGDLYSGPRATNQVQAALDDV